MTPTPQDVSADRQPGPRIINIRRTSPDNQLGRRITTLGRVTGSKMIIPSSSARGALHEAEIHDGLDKREFSSIYLPQHVLQSAQPISGYEVLGRWRREGRGVLMPKEFLDVAEKARDKTLIGKVNLQIVRFALREYASGRRSEKISKRLEIALNISCKALSKTFVTDVADEISRFELDPTRICIEVRAEELTHNEDSCNLLLAFRELGCNVAVDGFSLRSGGLSFLVEGVATRVKLARSFVSGVAVGSRERLALQHLVGLTKALNVQVLANGIEEQRQLDHIQSVGLEHGQGWLLSRPIDLMAA